MNSFLSRARALALIFALFAGCAPHKPSNIPPMPPPPSTGATASDIGDARTDAAGAQQNVRAGKVEAKADRGPAAVPMLDKADAQLSETLAHLDAATAHVAELEAQIKNTASAHDAQATAYQSQIAERDAANKKLATENDHLKNEVLRQAKLRIGALGSLLLIAAVGLVAAAIWGGFPIGFKLAPICGCMGAAALAIAVMLSKIVLGAEIALGLAALAALGYGAWQLFHHTPLNVAAQLQQLAGEKTALETKLKMAMAPKPAGARP